MKKHWKLAAALALAVVVAAGALGGTSLAQEAAEETDGWNLRERLHAAVAQVLGISVERYESAIETAEDQVVDQGLAEGWLSDEEAAHLRERLDGQLGARERARHGGGSSVGGSRYGVSLTSIAAEKLGMEKDELLNLLSQGKSIHDIAKEKEVDPQTIAEAYLEQLKQKLAEAVASGDLIQERADTLLAEATTTATERLASAGAGRPFGPKGHRLKTTPDSEAVPDAQSS